MALYRTQIWIREDFPLDPMMCPHCKSQNLRLSGNVYRAFELELKEGEQSSYSIDNATVTEELNQIACHKCKVLFVFEDREIYKMKEANFKMAEMLHPTPTRYLT